MTAPAASRADRPHAPSAMWGVTPRLVSRVRPAGRPGRAGARPCVSEDAGAGLWTKPSFSSSTAYVALSPQLAAVMVDADGREASHQSIGARGHSVHAAWNIAADNVLAGATRDGRTEFWVRDAAAELGGGLPPGYQLREDDVAPAAWLAHPRLFSAAHAHFTAIIRPRQELIYLTRDFRELFVFDAPAPVFARRFPSACVLRYSVGFPVVVAG